MGRPQDSVLDKSYDFVKAALILIKLQGKYHACRYFITHYIWQRLKWGCSWILWRWCIWVNRQNKDAGKKLIVIQQIHFAVEVRFSLPVVLGLSLLWWMMDHWSMSVWFCPCSGFFCFLIHKSKAFKPWNWRDLKSGSTTSNCQLSNKTACQCLSINSGLIEVQHSSQLKWYWWYPLAMAAVV